MGVEGALPDPVGRLAAAVGVRARPFFDWLSEEEMQYIIRELPLSLRGVIRRVEDYMQSNDSRERTRLSRQNCLKKGYRANWRRGKRPIILSD